MSIPGSAQTIPEAIGSFLPDCQGPMAPTWDSGPAQPGRFLDPLEWRDGACCVLAPVLWVKRWQPHGLASRAPLRAGRASEAPLRSAPAVRLVASERWPLALRAAVTPQPGLLRHAALGQLWHRESGCRFWWVCTSRGSWPSWPGPRPRLCPAGPSSQVLREGASNAGVRDVVTSGQAVFGQGRVLRVCVRGPLHPGTSAAPSVTWTGCWGGAGQCPGGHRRRLGSSARPGAVQWAPSAA